jgi:hypothetical protein
MHSDVAVFPWVISPGLSNGDRMCSVRHKIDAYVILLRGNSGLICEGYFLLILEREAETHAATK